MSFEANRIVPLLDDHRNWSERTFGQTVDRLARSEGIRKHLLQEIREIEADPDDWTEYADVFILAMDLAWRVEGNHAPTTAVELIESLGAKRLRLSTKSLIAELSSPYIPKASDIMAWAIRASAERGLSSDGFLFALGKKHAVNCRREWPNQIEGEPMTYRRNDATQWGNA